MFPQCWKPLCRTFLMVKAKKTMHRETVARQREKKEKVLCSVLQSRCQRKVDGTVLGVILFGLTEDSVLMNEISENALNEELNRIFLMKNSCSENICTRLGTTLEIPNLERRNSEYALIESRRELGSQRRQLLEANGQIKLSVREYTCAVNWR